MSGSFTAEEIQGACAMIHFKRFDIIRADQAFILFKAKLLRPNFISIPSPEFGGTPLELVCVKFTTRGRKLADKMEKSFKAQFEELGLDKDPYLSMGPNDDHMYLMHERRFMRENESDNQQKLVDCYAIGADLVSTFQC